MKTFSFIFGLSVIIFFLGSCEAGIKKDLMTGLKVSNKDLSYMEAYVNVDGKKTSGSEFPMNSILELHIEGVNGYTLTDGVVFLGASMTLVDSKNTEILNYPDLFEKFDSTGISPIDAKLISLTFTTGTPMENGQKYTWKTRVWDKKGKGEITTEMEITLK